MDLISSFIVGGAAIVCVIAVFFYVFRTKKQETETVNEGRGPQPRAVPRENVPPGARRRRPVDRLRRAREAEQARRDEDEGSEEEGDVFDYIEQPSGKIGAKKMAKLEEKVRKRAEREAMEREREEKKERDALMEEERQKEEARQKKLEAQKEEEEKKAREEKEKQEYEEYLAMKSQFAVEEEGEDAVMQTDESDLLQQFVDYIKKMKVVILEDLASHFSIKTQAVIDRIESLMADGTLTGVLDDRGKFIYVTMDELQAVAKFIKQRGRVTIQELAESSNRLVRLTPELGA
ncbi:DDRGK domain-containing protein 1-like [Watersipora subatra]|uniref:DDRGK domain-containing protein 1-like n=1 Tax=Watersipora subatra TaxID=2589382 RepID=UPI00355B0DB0